jgi:tripartite-type tricarboxylate transporter receptor subunit TctC
VAALNAAAVEALNDPRIRERLTNDAQFVKASTPEAFAAFLQEQLRVWTPTLRRLDVPLN